jgi:hypothetical protein
MAAIRHEARGAAREPDGGTPGRANPMGKKAVPTVAYGQIVWSSILEAALNTNTVQCDASNTL